MIKVAYTNPLLSMRNTARGAYRASSIGIKVINYLLFKDM